jgi:hypothetical protein
MGGGRKDDKLILGFLVRLAMTHASETRSLLCLFSSSFSLNKSVMFIIILIIILIKQSVMLETN